MSETVQLVQMKQYALDRLSKSDEPAIYTSLQRNGQMNGHAGNRSPTSPVSPTASVPDLRTGFIANKEYGDWGTTPSPTKAENTLTVPPTLPRQTVASRTTSKPMQRFIPEHEIEIPESGSLREFNADDMSTFLRYMGVEERIVTHVHKKGLDGLKFSKLKDSDLEALNMKNPIICHFRDKSGSRDKGGKKKAPFML